MEPQEILNKNPKLANRLDRADRIISYSMIGGLIVTIALMMVIIAQLTSATEEIKHAGATNHQKTQQYVRCIASTLLVPVAERGPGVFDSCGIEGTVEQKSNKKTNKSVKKSEPTTTQPAPVAEESKTPPRNQPTTSEPPDKTTPRSAAPSPQPVSPEPAQEPSTMEPGLVTRIVNSTVDGVNNTVNSINNTVSGILNSIRGK